MSTRRNFFGKGRPDFGIGISVSPDEVPMDEDSIVYESFIGGLDMSDAPENVANNKAVYCVDMQVTRSDRLTRAPGIAEISTEPHSLLYTFQQSSLGFDTELVAIDPPFLGYKGSGAWNWFNLALANTGVFGWNAVNYINDLLFSNGVDKTYSRATGAGVVVDQSANVVARTFTQQFGRLFAGYYTAAGIAYALGIKWNDTTGLVGGWGGTGAGNELLVAPDQSPDYVVALRPIGYDLLAILNRNSLWAGYPTKIDKRPADFRLRIPGVGCVHERTARSTPGGVTFLSDEGVVNYDVNNWNIISGQINSELLPLQYYNLSRYTAAYTPQNRRYYLQTPLGIYIYEFPIPELNIPGRWLKRSAIVDTVVPFADQSAVTSWDDLIGSWDSQTDSWDTLGMPAWAAPLDIFFTLGNKLGQEDSSIFTWFGTALTPAWRTPQAAKKRITDQLITVGWEIAYVSTAESTINLLTPDENGLVGGNTVAIVLPSTVGVTKSLLIWNTQSGRGLQTQIEIAAGSPQILRIRQMFQSFSPNIGTEGDADIFIDGGTASI